MKKIKDTYGTPVFLRNLMQSKIDQAVSWRLTKFPENTKNTDQWQAPSLWLTQSSSTKSHLNAKI